jgi:uncharacterized protein YijF (DUF1287 family)
MNTLVAKHEVWVYVVACLGAVWGLLPGQVNPAGLKTVQAKRQQLVDAALSQVGVTTGYDAQYVKLGFPGGDVPEDAGVCTDVVVRALRKVNVDLQMLVHEDKKKAPQAYPNDWGKGGLDANIDHRRVPNLMTFFERQGKDMVLTTQPEDYLPGDIVVWRLPSGLLHIGVVSDRVAPGTQRPLMVHNIGGGAQCEDVLFSFTLVAHYRWFM